MKFKSPSKTKRRGFAIFTCAILAFLAVFGVGFSSWVVVNYSELSSNALVEVGTVSQPSIFSSPKIDTFSISKDGAIKDEVFAEKGIINSTFYVYNQWCVENGYLDASDNFSFRASLSCSDATFLSLVTDLNVTLPSSATKVKDEQTVETKTSFTVTFKMNKASSSTYVSMDFSLEGDIAAYYGKAPKMTLELEALLP